MLGGWAALGMATGAGKGRGSSVSSLLSSSLTLTAAEPLGWLVDPLFGAPGNQPDPVLRGKEPPSWMEAKARRDGDDVGTNSTLRPKQASKEELVEQPAQTVCARDVCTASAPGTPPRSLPVQIIASRSKLSCCCRARSSLLCSSANTHKH